MTTRVSIDSNTCIGSGMCALTAPSIFTQDDDGYGVVLAGREGGEGDSLLKEAARSCPVQAVTITD
ncbi:MULTISPECIES: ferredoxin [unclassified Streptomyces]|uniref:ferredoxin n=1 Tax=unclassified Streptomyces TaxID=2593676 RepID=UPI0033182436